MKEKEDDKNTNWARNRVFNILKMGGMRLGG